MRSTRQRIGVTMFGSGLMLDVKIIRAKDSQPSHEDPLWVLQGFKPGECGIVCPDKEFSPSEEELVGIDSKDESQQFSLVGCILRLTGLQPSSIERYWSSNTILNLRQDRSNAIR